VVGTEDGHLYQLKGRKVFHIVVANEARSPIGVLKSYSEGIISGSQDGTIQLWNNLLEPQLNLSLKQLGSSLDAGIRSFSFDCNNCGWFS